MATMKLKKLQNLRKKMEEVHNKLHKTINKKEARKLETHMMKLVNQSIEVIYSIE